LPEVRQLEKEQRELKSLINTRDKLIKLRSNLKNKMHNILNDDGIASKREMFSSEVSYERLKGLKLFGMVKFEIEVIVEQIKSLDKSIKEIEGKIKESGGKKSIRNIISITQEYVS
jgi:transposase